MEDLDDQHVAEKGRRKVTVSSRWTATRGRRRGTRCRVKTPTTFKAGEKQHYFTLKRTKKSAS